MQRQLWRHNPHLHVDAPIPEKSQLPFRVELEILRGRVKQRVRPILNPAFLIGMADDCDLVLGDPQFPEVHTYIRISKTGVTLRHLGFAPALTINGESAHQQMMHDGDRIRTGPFEFLVHLYPEASGDDDTDKSRLLRMPAALDRVEDEVGNALVQQLLTEIRRELVPAAQLRLFVAQEPTKSPANKTTSTLSTLQEPHHAYARSS